MNDQPSYQSGALLKCRSTVDKSLSRLLLVRLQMSVLQEFWQMVRLAMGYRGKARSMERRSCLMETCPSNQWKRVMLVP